MRTDHIGRPSFATDGMGAVVWDVSYKPFAKLIPPQAPRLTCASPTLAQAGAYAAVATGQWFSAESDLNQNWMRDYDPTTGRYIQADPLGLVDGASVYG